MAIEMLRLTREFVWWRIETDDDLSPSDAEVAFTEAPNDFPGEEDWVEAMLIDPSDETYGDGVNWWVGLLVGPGGAKELIPDTNEFVDYQSWVRITDEPERPVRKPGIVTIL